MKRRHGRVCLCTFLGRALWLELDLCWGFNAIASVHTPTLHVHLIDPLPHLQRFQPPHSEYSEPLSLHAYASIQSYPVHMLPFD